MNGSRGGGEVETNRKGGTEHGTLRLDMSTVVFRKTEGQPRSVTPCDGILPSLIPCLPSYMGTGGRDVSRPTKSYPS